MKQVETRHGPMWVLEGDAYVGRSLELYGDYSPREVELLTQVIRPGAVIVEAGANIGAQTVPLARACAPGRLYAFEPQQPVFQALCANLVANGIGNVTALPEALGAAEGRARMPAIDYARPQNFGSVGVLAPDSSLPGPPVRMATIDALGLPACRLIKVDVEGYELDVLRGAAETLGRCRPVLYVEAIVAEHQQALIDLIDGFGYRQWWHATPLFEADNWAGKSENVFPGVSSLNILAIHKDTPGGPPAPPINPANWVSPVTPISLASLAPRVGA
jgi:FkbM family methyltransferase